MSGECDVTMVVQYLYGGPFVEEDSRISCQMYDIVRKTTNGMDGQCEKSIEKGKMSVEQGRMIVYDKSK